MIITRQGGIKDIPQVLALQSLYLYANLSLEERQQGFVTTPFTSELIDQIIQQEKGLFVAEDTHTNTIVAYAFAGSWSYFEQWEIFQLMLERLPQTTFNSQPINKKNSFQYGPICIHKKYRSQGVINKIFEEMRLTFEKQYPISLTFINKVNAISTAAHLRKLNGKIVDEFSYNHNEYITLAFDMQTSVL